jgi:hypothetical protein
LGLSRANSGQAASRTGGRLARLRQVLFFLRRKCRRLRLAGAKTGIAGVDMVVS